MKVFIIIPIFNRGKCTIDCVESIINTVNDIDYEIVVIDDGSSYSTKSILKKTLPPSVTLLETSGGLFWSGTVNFGINYLSSRISGDDFLLIVNNDVEFEKSTIDELLLSYQKKPTLSCHSSISVDRQSKIVSQSGSFLASPFFNITKKPFKGKRLNNVMHESVASINLTNARSLLIPSSVVNLIGVFNSEDFPQYGGDSEFSMRCWHRGVKTFLVPSSVVYLKKNADCYDNDEQIKKDAMSFLWFLTNVRSPYQLKTIWNFSREIRPRIARTSYLIISIVKIIASLILLKFFKKEYGTY